MYNMNPQCECSDGIGGDTYCPVHGVPIDSLDGPGISMGSRTCEVCGREYYRPAVSDDGTCGCKDYRR